MKNTPTTLSHSARKFIARQKSLIRKQFSDVKKQEEAIAALYAPKEVSVKAEKKEEKPVEKKAEKKAEKKTEKKEKQDKK